MAQQKEQLPQQQPITDSKVIGVPTPRIDGPLKTTGKAMYSSDHSFPGLLYAWPVTATVSGGTVQKIDASMAKKMPGVIAIYTHEDIGPLYRTPPAAGFSMIIDEHRPPLEDTIVRYYGQYVAVAVAQTMEQARAAAEAVKVSYGKTEFNVDAKLLGTTMTTPKAKEATKRGDTAAALKSGPVTHDAVYTTPAETHNPTELFRSGGQTFLQVA